MLSSLAVEANKNARLNNNHSAVVNALVFLSHFHSLCLNQQWRSLCQPCQIPTLTNLLSPESLAGLTALRCKKPLSVKCTSDSSPVALDSNFDMELFRKNWTRSKNYNRRGPRGFGLKEESLELMNRQYTSWVLLTVTELHCC